MTAFAIIFALILINGFFAMSELAILSSRKLRLKSLARKGSTGAKAALALSAAPTRFLSTVQIGITLVGIIAGAFGEATIARSIQGWLEHFPFLVRWSEEISFFLMVIVIGYLTLVLGELIPKRIALVSPERTASFLALPMQALSVVAAPFVHLLSFSTDSVLRLLRLNTSTEHVLTEEEFVGLIEESRRSGVFEKQETDMMRNVMRLGNRTAGDVMTPRTEILWLDLNQPAEELHHIVRESAFSRFPVGRGNIDNLIGVLEAKNLVRPLDDNTPMDIESLLHKPLVVPESMPALNLLAEFRTNANAFALVADEFGAILGAVTSDDVLQSIVGDTGHGIDARSAQPNYVQRDDGSWLICGSMPIDETRDLLHLDTLPGEAEGHYRTLAGFIMVQLGHLPVTGEKFTFLSYVFEVVDMDGNRVDKVLVTPVETASPTAITDTIADDEF